MSRKDSPEDLLVLARRCKLGPEDERRFEIAVQSSRELEALYNAGVQFDEEASVLPGDETRSSLLVERALARLDEGDAVHAPRAARAASARSVRRSMAARQFAVSLAFGVLLSVALASAWEYVKSRERPHPPDRAPAGVVPRPEHKPLPAVESLPAPPPEPLPSASAAAPIAETPQRVLAAPSSRESIPRTSEELTASQLFAQANELRRKGDIEGAISSYEHLCAQHPHSPQAEDARLLMGNLLLSQRSPRAALQKFEDYGSGPLALEALWGRARALRMLGSPDERPVLEQLVRDYPNSPYTGAAQKRLREISP
jgi:TolA-binding protein